MSCQYLNLKKKKKSFDLLASYPKLQINIWQAFITHYLENKGEAKLLRNSLALSTNLNTHISDIPLVIDLLVCS